MDHIRFPSVYHLPKLWPRKIEFQTRITVQRDAESTDDRVGSVRGDGGRRAKEDAGMTRGLEMHEETGKGTSNAVDFG